MIIVVGKQQYQYFFSKIAQDPDFVVKNIYNESHLHVIIPDSYE